MNPKARALHCNSLDRLTNVKRASLLGPFSSYEENKVL